ncbi:MAG: peptidase S41 [Burkholderiaceae bacterium]|nr:peptidase S41 [Burkholderiaceae bacterium]
MRKIVGLGGGLRGALVGAAALAATVLTSCGGASNANGPDSPIFANAQACSPNNPFRNDATGATTVGSLTIEKNWVRGYVDSQYLWFSQVPNVNPSILNYSNESDVYTSLDNYFNALTALPQDRFSFTYPTAAWDALINSGSSVGYGIEWHIASSTPPRGIRVAYVHPGSPAASAGVLRGDTLVLADGVSADEPNNPGVTTLNNALFPGVAGSHTFRFSRAGMTRPDINLAAGAVTLTPTQHQVLNVGGQNVGYLLFNDHVLTAEQPLVDAFTAFQSAGVTDLVLDLRYNGGGYLYIASQVAYMIAGPTRINNRVFERTVFNSKRSSENADTGFLDIACLPDPNNNFTCTTNTPLPTLDLPRVFVLTSGSTCSASEAIVNGLRGVDVEVRLIGRTTCGKPYGFFGQDNCGVTYFPIEFQGINAKNFGAYADGFVPAGSGAAGVPGCTANDDLDHALGDPAEGQLAQALFHRASGNCMAVALGSSRASPLSVHGSEVPAAVIKPAPLTNRNARKPLR